MFAAGDLVVYGGEGVCRVERISTPVSTGVITVPLRYRGVR